MRTRLPVRDRPRPDESANGYLGRIAHINGYRSAADLFISALPNRPRVRGDVAVLAGIEPLCLEHMPGPWPSWIDGESREDMLVKASWVNGKRIRWCPGCLREDHYMRSVWSLKLFVACPRHAVMLRDACDICGATFRSGRLAFKKCPCGQSFAEMRCNVADHTVIEIMHQCQPGVSKTSPQVPIATHPLNKLTVQKMLLLLHSLAPLVEGHAQRKTGIVPNLQDIECAVRYVRECAELLADWPNSFRAWMLRRTDTVSPTTSIRRAFGPLYDVLYRELADRAYDFLRREFEIHLAEYWPGTIDGRHRRLAPVMGLHDALSCKEIRCKLACSRATVKRLLADGSLRGTVLRSPTGRDFVVSDHASVEHAREKLKSCVDLRTASRELGISRPRIRLLLDAGLIRSETRRHETGLRWSIPRAEVDRWLTPASATSTEYAWQPKVSLAHVFKYRCRTDAAFIAIAQALSDGTLLSAGRVPGLRHFLIHKSACLESILDSKSARRGLLTMRISRLLSDFRHEDSRRRGSMGGRGKAGQAVRQPAHGQHSGRVRGLGRDDGGISFSGQ